VASDFCCAPIYLEGGWYSVGGTSWGTPTFAGIVNAAANKQKSTVDELTWIYDELFNPAEYAADFYDITQGASQCMVGWDLCSGVGSARTLRWEVIRFGKLIRASIAAPPCCSTQLVLTLLVTGSCCRNC
jgi:hypothetical protein